MLCVAVPFALIGPILWQDLWPDNHETLRYPALVEGFYEALIAGKTWPRWLPELYGGYGYPTFVFYQPLFFFIASVFRFFVGDPTSAALLAIGAVLAVGSIGSFRLCGGAREPALGLLGAGLFVSAPYTQLEWLVRGDLSELTAMSIVPWAIERFLSVIERPGASPIASTRSIAGLATAMALTLIAHPIIGILLGATVAMMTVAAAFRARISTLLHVALAGICALLLAAPYWVPLYAERSSARLETSGALNGVFDPVRQLLPLESAIQFLGPLWKRVSGLPESERIGVPIELGSLALATGLSGAYLAGRRIGNGVLLFGFVVTLTIMTEASEPLWRISPFSSMQFPWRVLTLSTCLLLALLRGWRASLLVVSSRTKFVLVTLFLLIGVQPTRFRMGYEGTRELVNRGQRTLHDRFVTHDMLGELLPITSRTRPSELRRPTSPMFEIDHGRVSLLPDHTQYVTHARIEASEDAKVIINQLYFPGWDVELDHQRIPDSILRSALEADGRIRVQVGRGQHEIRATYGGPPLRRARWSAFVAGIALLIAPDAWQRWRRRRRV